jgi:hypothetical protein
LTRDFIQIGMASYVMDTGRTKQELVANWQQPALADGLQLL